MLIEPRLNGRPTPLDVEPQELLLDVLRERLGLTGAKRSCDVQVCGTCTVLVDGAPVSACTYLAVEADRREVITIEGFRDSPAYERIADAFTRHAAVQCGFCTPAFVLTVHALAAAGELRDREAARHQLSGNLCRCTGYRSILEAVAELAELLDPVPAIGPAWPDGLAGPPEAAA
jgi:aerobic-type carbon monoxide dehydrogenase small subunit (CoxS/CutS family)